MSEDECPICKALKFNETERESPITEIRVPPEGMIICEKHAAELAKENIYGMADI
jgi:hypothetical protein